MDIEIEKIYPSTIIAVYLKEKFPYQNIDYIYYDPKGPQPGDYKAPEFRIQNRPIGWLQGTKFTPYYAYYIRPHYKTLDMADPRFFEIFHIVAVYTLGYDPLKPGSREAFMETSTDPGLEKYYQFHPEMNIVYFPLV